MKDERKKPLIAGVERSLRSLPFRFHRKRLEWSAALPETTIAIALDRSRFGDIYQIELGAHPNEFVNPYYPFKREDISSYAVRAGEKRVIPAGMDLRCFDLEIPMDPADREDCVAGVVALLVPSLVEWSTIEGLRTLAADPKRAFFVHDSLTKWLGVPLRKLPPGSRTAEREGPPLASPEPARGESRIGDVIVRPYERRE